jgi:hypothetical protein
MSANNKRVRRAIVQILWAHGPMTKETLADKLQDIKSIRQVPSPNSLSALLSKNPQVISVGTEKVVSANGVSSKHMVFAIDSYLIQDEDDLLYTTPHNIMSPSQKKDATKCSTCGRTRILPPESASCLHCIRDE